MAGRVAITVGGRVGGAESTPLHVYSACSGSTQTVSVPTRGSVGHGRGLATLISMLRGSVLLLTKKLSLAHALERTVTRAKKAEDDYD